MRVAAAFMCIFGAYGYAHLNGLIDLQRAVPLALGLGGLVWLQVEIALAMRERDQ